MTNTPHQVRTGVWLSAAVIAYGAVSPRGLFLAPSLQLGTSSCSMPPVNVQNQNVRYHPEHVVLVA